MKKLLLLSFVFLLSTNFYAQETALEKKKAKTEKSCSAEEKKSCTTEKKGGCCSAKKAEKAETKS